MRLGTIALLLGIALLQPLRQLPAAGWCWLLLPLLPAAWRFPRARPPALVLAGLLWALFHAHAVLSTRLAAALEGKDVEVNGVITALPQRGAHGTRFTLDLASLSRDGIAFRPPARVRLNWYGEAPLLTVGDVWHLKVRLRRPWGYRNPGGFDYEGSLFRQGIRATGYVRDDAANQRRGARGLRYAVGRLRQRASRAIAGQLRRGPYAGIITAVAVGDRHAVSPDQWRVFNATGTTHLMAISGLHISLVAGLLFFLVRRAWAWTVLPHWPWPAPKAAAVAAFGGAVFYAAMAGFSIPTQRALIMLAVALAGILRQRHYAPSVVLCVALCLVLVADPLAVLSPGFWLSFLAVGLILYGVSGRWAAGGWWWAWGRVHWLVTLGLLPVVVFFFQRTSVCAPLANAVAVPWVSLAVVPLTLLGLVLDGLVPAAGALCLTAAHGAMALLWPVLQWLARLNPPAGYHAAPWWAVPTAIAGTLLWLAPRGLPARHLGVLLLAPLFVAAAPGPDRGQVWFTLLDVGQGLSAVVRTATHTLVYDTGPRLSEQFDTGATVVIPYLRASGIEAVNMLVVSHGDNDHIGGAASILQHIPVAQVLTSVPRRLPGPRTRRCDDDQAWVWDGVRFTILNPPAGSPRTGNNASCVLRVEDRAGHILLLTGDIQRSAEQALLRDHRGQMAADIMTVPHHGSDTSSTRRFVKAVNPRYALFPVGYRNRYGFPKDDVVARYAAQGAALYDTARDGALTFRLGAGDTIAPPRRYRLDKRHYWHSF